MATTTLEEFRTDFPEFRADNPTFQSEFTDAEETAFERFIDAVSETFSTKLFGGYKESTQKYILHLYLAHCSWLSFLPRHRKIPQMIFGDQSSASTTEGNLSVSYSRISYSEFLTDPYLSLTNYGAELAHYIRKENTLRGFVLSSRGQIPRADY